MLTKQSSSEGGGLLPLAMIEECPATGDAWVR